MQSFHIGDTPAVRNHPALKGVALPEKLGIAGAQFVLIATLTAFRLR